MRDIPRVDWSAAGLDRECLLELESLVENGATKSTDMDVWISSDQAVSLPGRICDALGFPPPAALGLSIALDGRIETPAGLLRLRWTDKWGREVRPERAGLLLQWGEQVGRLNATLFRLVDAIGTYNGTIGSDFERRVSAWLPVQDTLKHLTGAEVKRDGFLETFTLYQAGAFALDVRETANGVDFAPVLMSRNREFTAQDDEPADAAESPIESNVTDSIKAHASEDWNAALLSAEDQRSFVVQAIGGAGQARDAYQVGRNRFVLIDPALKLALDVLKEKRKGSEEERRAFVRNPRAAIAHALESAGEGTVPGQLFVETKHYSDRVEGLGLWERPQLPWLTRRPNAWLPEAGWIVDGPVSELAPLSAEELAQVEEDIQKAEIRGDAHVVIRGCPIPIDSAPEVLAEERRRSATVPQEEVLTLEDIQTEGHGKDPKQRLVLLIKKTNFDGVEYELGLRRRTALIDAETPPAARMGSTPLKPHQIEGFRWLVQTWTAGWPGVLLADDMGLGKTYQALAFLAWLKANAAALRAQGATHGPFLIVAPTALLRNWEKESLDRLSGLGLGQRIDAYGSALKQLKLPRSAEGNDQDTLDVAQLREADWILTTYETLTDHERSFARVAYSVVLFDEMQKIKSPDTLNTKAAKALNAEFVIGLTGTPIENRMEDLWCLFDRLVPGFLGDLKSFSRTFQQDSPEKLSELKRTLDTPLQAAPPVMKRRMKVDILEGLPTKQEKKYPTEMPAGQAQAYRELIQEARGSGDRSRGFMLKVLHGMRGVSLHPEDPSSIDLTGKARFDMFVRGSARLLTTVELLEQIASRNEKALLFIENLAMQEVLARGLAMSFGLDRKPAIINGSTPGERRLAIVESFEKSGDGFGLLILSPKAAGVGLNIVAANHVIHLSRWWNPAVEDQCNDRAYRIGQTKPVNIHIPMATHPDLPNESFDEVLDRLLEAKRRLSRDMLTPPTSDSDIESLFGKTVRS
ncbi:MULTISPECIES: DEAD/DEAH box helicase [unclassified Bradyrhizobium]|uniref:DEAD/DEAH box helicase n=1 Tax=unclassified Bradyrhizobium TaxID=2631580 RepID=UPI002479240D|nr:MULTISPECIES: DEAD/DEAH box helicase [unclassified Bradyrhizobium]WGS18960.1 DEAD/DEAH box helicase [Bradyrhizobium sp. ISRA463]WGS25794.1 DEAD/DEAH box helicase [Bradyrhizobium sp. ISRA464]